MAVGKILRKSLAKDLEISGQEVISGTYQENINRFQTTVVIDVENPNTKVKIDDPSSLPEGVGLGVSFSQNEPYLAIAHIGSPFLSIYKQDGDVFTKLLEPDVPPSSIGINTVFSPNGMYLAVATDLSPFIVIYKRNGDNFVKLSEPDIPPSDVEVISSNPTVFMASDIDFSPDSNYLAIAMRFKNLATGDPPFIIIYKRDGDTFTKLPNPDVLPPTGGGSFFNNPSGALSTAFSANGDYLAVGHYKSPFVTIYKRNGDTFTKLPDPSILPQNVPMGVSFSNDGSYLAGSYFVSPFLIIYKRNNDTFTKLTDPDTLPPAQSDSVDFTSDGNYLAVSHVSTPFITVYKRNEDAFTKLPNPDILPAGSSWDATFSFDGSYLAVGHSTSPFVTIYKNGFEDGIIKANNAILPNSKNLGYALENGTEGEVKTMMSLFKEEE